MSGTTPSPFMLMPVPIPTMETGPQWSYDIAACLSIVDSHNHSSGQGQPIQPNGLNINSDLPFGGNNATLLRTVRFNSLVSAPAAAADIGCLSLVGNELYFNDYSGGHSFAITNNGSVNAGAGSITGLPSGTASATFSSGTFVWQSATNTAANLDAASIVLRNSSANSHGLTLSPPAAMGANITQTLPAIPGSQSFMTMDSSGNMGTPAVYPLPGTAIATQAITQDLLALRATGTTVAAGGIAVSAAVNSYSNSTGTFTTITSVTITTTGRPIVVMLQPAVGGSGTISVSGTGTSSTGFFQLGLSTSFTEFIIGTLTGSAGNCFVEVSPGTIYFIDLPAAGTYTYTLGAKVNPLVNPGTVSANGVQLVAYEM